MTVPLELESDICEPSIVSAANPTLVPAMKQ